MAVKTSTKWWGRRANKRFCIYSGCGEQGRACAPDQDTCPARWCVVPASSLIAGNACEHIALLSENIIGMYCMFQLPKRPACVWWTAVFLSYIQMRGLIYTAQVQAKVSTAMRLRLAKL